MRKLLWFTIGFAAACAGCVYLLGGIWIALLAAIGFAAAVVLLLLKYKWGKVAAAILIGLTVGCLWFLFYDSLYLQTARAYDGKTVSAVVTVSDYSYETDYGVAADGVIELEGQSYRVRVYRYSDGAFSPGDKISGEFRLRLTLRGSLQGATYHEGEGVFLLAYAAEDADITRAEKITLKYFSAWLRQKIIDIMDTVFPEDALAFARALLLGDSSLLSYEQDTSFKVSGIRHVIAVSGLHVSILFGLVYMLSGRRRVSTALLGIPVLVLFAAVAGFTPSIIRACIMQLLIILALLFNKEYDPPTALAFAVLVMLAVNPMTITSVSLQLSVGCLIGIFLFQKRINEYLLNRIGKPKGMSLKARLIRWFAGSVSVTLSATVVTTPLSAYHFGTVSLVGTLTNLLTMWIISFVFYGIMLACVLGSFWVAGAKIIAWVVAWPIRFVMLVAKILSGFSASAVYTCSIYIVIWLVFCYVLLTVFFLSRKKYPAVLAGCVLAGLVLAVAASWIEPRLDDYRITVLDVGQGQSILLQCDGGNYLIDCGGDNDEKAADTAAQQLLSQGITHLDGIILTHYDRDHAGGVLPLLTRIQTDRLYLPDIEDEEEIKADLQNLCSDRISWIKEQTVLSLVTAKISLFPADETAKGNDCSMCILFQSEDCDILIIGDRSTSGESALMKQVQLPQLELLVVGHHGSKYSTSMELLHAVKPLAAVICVGEDNSYGHPDEAVLSRLKLFGCRIWRTDLDGTITFRR